MYVHSSGPTTSGCSSAPAIHGACAATGPARARQRSHCALSAAKKPRVEDSATHAYRHKSNSNDRLVVRAGDIWMVMEEGETLLRQGDCIVQRGTTHAWVNKPCMLMTILIDAALKLTLRPLRQPRPRRLRGAGACRHPAPGRDLS